MTNDGELITISDNDDDETPAAVCYQCGLVAGPDWDEVILGTDGRFVCWECATDEDKEEFYS